MNYSSKLFKIWLDCLVYKAIRALRAHFFYSLCEYVLFKNIKKQRKTNYVDFFNFQKSDFEEGKLSKILSFINLPYTLRGDTHEIWARSVQPFWRLLDTNIQTNKLNCIVSIEYNFFCVRSKMNLTVKKKVKGCYKLKLYILEC